MATVDTLQAEARERPRMTVVAALAAVFTLAGALVGRVGSNTPNNLPAALLDYHRHPTAQYVSAGCSVLAALLVAVVLDFLFRAVRARNPELPWQIRPLVWAGGVGVAALVIASQIALRINAGHFATHGSQTYEEARKAIAAGVPPVLGLLFQLVFAAAIVLVALQAMRVGLLTRVLGYLGVVSGALFLLPLVPIPIVQVYWLGALALLFAGRLPNGTPPAWQSGEAIPWPTAAEQREARVRAAEARRGDGGDGDDSVEGSLAEPEDELPGLAPAKRKRKKRR
ncbi:MAG TPA: hypothetical protein VN635_01665 [Conexibacter sp.]|nr:hypothetical protein [Conexibacter sp.]